MGEINGLYRPSLYKNLGPAVLEANAIIVTVPSSGTAREEVVENLAQYELSEKMLVWVPGNLASLLIEPRLATRATFETTTSPYGCRLQNGKAFVKAIKRVVEIASDKSDLPEAIRHDVESLFPRKLDWRENILEIALLSTNCILHPATVLMNAGRIESTGGDFFFYREGMTPSVGQVITSMDKTRLEILARFNFKRTACIHLLNHWYDTQEPDIVSFARNSIPHNATTGSPFNMKHRYLMEDCRMLVSYKELAKKFNIEAHAISAVLVMASIVTKEEFAETGLSLKDLDHGELYSTGADDLLRMWGSSKDVLV